MEELKEKSGPGKEVRRSLVTVTLAPKWVEEDPEKKLEILKREEEEFERNLETLERGLKLKAQGKKLTAKAPWLILFKCSGASEEGFQAWEEKVKEELVRRLKRKDIEELLKGLRGPRRYRQKWP